MNGWSATFAAPAMLWGLAAVALPVVIHLLNRRRAVEIDWGAMQFLELGRKARRRLRLEELLLMAGRMGVLALVALALARPLLGGGGTVAGGGGGPRDVVVILDGSESLERLDGAATRRGAAIEAAWDVIARLPQGSSVAIVDARERPRVLLAPLSTDRDRAREALRAAGPGRGGADLPAAIAEGWRLLEAGRNPARDLVILTDERRSGWRLDEAGRWRLLRDLHADLARRGGAPRLWVGLAGGGGPATGADGAVARVAVERDLVPAGLPLTVRAEVVNLGPGRLEGRAAELLRDGAVVPGSARAVEALSPGAATTLEFTMLPATPGVHELAVRLSQGDDPLEVNDEAATLVEAATALPVVVVEGRPGAGPFAGEADFVRAALSPRDDAAPAVAARVVPAARFRPAALSAARVLILAGVERLTREQEAAVAAFLARGGGVLAVFAEATDLRGDGPGREDRAGWLPIRSAAAGPAGRLGVSSFAGPVMGPLGRGDEPALGRAEIARPVALEPVEGAAVEARLDDGRPWLVVKPWGAGLVGAVGGSLSARGGTLAVNPDFVPWLHALVYRLAGPSGAVVRIAPGAAYHAEVPASAGLAAEAERVAVRRPDGARSEAVVERLGGVARVRFDATDEPGVYAVEWPAGPAGRFVVEADPRERDPAPLSEADLAALAEGWPFEAASGAASVAGRMLDGGGRASGPRPVWRWLIAAALGGLCLEIAATRRLARRRGLAAEEGEDEPSAAAAEAAP